MFPRWPVDVRKKCKVVGFCPFMPLVFNYRIYIYTAKINSAPVCISFYNILLKLMYGLEERNNFVLFFSMYSAGHSVLCQKYGRYATCMYERFSFYHWTPKEFYHTTAMFQSDPDFGLPLFLCLAIRVIINFLL